MAKMFRPLVASRVGEEEAHQATLSSAAWVLGEQEVVGSPRDFERESERIEIDRAANRFDG